MHQHLILDEYVIPGVCECDGETISFVLLLFAEAVSLKVDFEFMSWLNRPSGSLAHGAFDMLIFSPVNSIQ